MCHSSIHHPFSLCHHIIHHVFFCSQMPSQQHHHVCKMKTMMLQYLILFSCIFAVQPFAPPHNHQVKRGGGGAATHNRKYRPLRSCSSHLPPKLEHLVKDTLDSDRKIVVVTGGVLSGIGKGVTASSIGVLFRAMGYRVTALKIDPYLNVDAGTMVS